MSLPTVSSISTEQLQNMGEQLQSLARRVEQLEVQAGAPAESPSEDESLRAAIVKAAEFAGEVFRCVVQVEQDYDPELPNWSWYNVCVTTNADHEELMKLRRQWYDRIATLKYPDPTTIRLLVTFPE